MATTRKPASKAAAPDSGKAANKREATTPRKAPSRTPKPKAEQASAVVDAAVKASPIPSSGKVVLVSTATGQRVFHDASGKRHVIAGGGKFEVDAKTAKVLLADDAAFAVAIGEEPTDAGNVERLTTPALSGAVTTDDLGKGGKIGAAAEEANAKAAATKADPDATNAGGSPDPAGDEGAAASTLSTTDPAAATVEAGTETDPPTVRGAGESGPGATVLS